MLRVEAAVQFVVLLQSALYLFPGVQAAARCCAGLHAQVHMLG